MKSRIRELFHSNSYRDRRNYYYDDGVVTYGAGRGMFTDVVLHVPMDSLKCVERVKRALDIEGVYRVNANLMNQTVIISGNVPAESLLRRVRWIKRHSQILSVGSSYGSSSYGSGYPISNPYAFDRYPPSPTFSKPFDEYNDSYDMVEYGSSYYQSRPYSSAYSYY